MNIINSLETLNFDLPPTSQFNKSSLSIPHPIPYQGSKRKLAPVILQFVISGHIKNFYEPFAGSAAMTLAAAAHGVAEKYHINDSLIPLIGIWERIHNFPDNLSQQYKEIWEGNNGNELTHYYEVRDKFNQDRDPAKLLYLLARCVKNAVRFNANGDFNQSADKRRLGTHPIRMRKAITESSLLLKGRTTLTSLDYYEVLDSADRSDFVYMDPPWEGTSGTKNTRYHKLLDKEKLIKQLELLIRKDVPYLLSFDGRLGKKTYGEGLPADLKLTRIEIDAGRSSQATLSGKSDSTFESLYLSPALVKKIDNAGLFYRISQFLPQAHIK